MQETILVLEDLNLALELLVVEEGYTDLCG
jgi:hypothetical protein